MTWTFPAQIEGSVRVSMEGDVYPKISIPHEQKAKMPPWVELAGAVVEVRITLKGQ